MSHIQRYEIAIALALSLTAAVPNLAAQERGLDILVKKATGQTDLDVGKQYAVIIGIDAYKEWQSLRSAVAEARQVKAVLERRYWIDEFIELYDSDASASNIRKLFVDSLPAKLENRDSLLVFYAGHGYTDKTKTGFWIASDGTKDIYDQRGWISNQQLRNMIGGLQAQRILVMADACFAGDFLDTKRGPPVQIDSAYYRNALKLTARQVLTSGSSESVPDESEFGRQLVSMLERNTETLLDPNQMYDRIKLGVTKTQPLLGTIPGNEQGANFVLFLKAPASPAPALSPVVKAPQQVVVSATYGSVMVNVAESGTLYLNGSALVELRAGAKKRLDNLETGWNHLEIRYPGGANEALDVQVEEGTVATVSFSWKPATSGALVVKTEPVGARVLVDGVDRGQSPLNLDLSAGSVTVTVSAGGYEDARQVKQVEAGKTTELSIVLKKTAPPPLALPAAIGDMVLVKGGPFMMGSNEGSSDEKPVHEVRVADYYIGKYEVTQAQYRQVTGTNPSNFKGDNLPVEKVSWFDAVAFCNALSDREGLRKAYTISGTNVSADWSADGYRLPTEAEWEYSARGGPAVRTVKYAGTENIDQVAWYYSNSRGTTHPVGQKMANYLGLYDMSGNVSEWCWDYYDSSYYAKSTSADPKGGSSSGSRVMRGGAWNNDSDWSRVANRYNVTPSFGYEMMGFRLARSPQSGIGN